MIYKNDHETTGVYLNDRAFGRIYKGAQLVWEAVRSCFGKGWWIPSKPWISNDVWKY